MAGDFISLSKKDSKASISGVGGRNSTGIKGAKSSVFFNESLDGEPRHSDLFAVRLLGRTGYVELLKDVIKDQVASTDFHVKPVIPEGEDREPSQREQDAANAMTEFFKGNFNSDNQSFDHLLKAILNDVLDFNTGAIELVSDDDGFLEELIVRDGLTFTKNLLDVGKLPEPDSGDPAYYQFSLSSQAQQFFRSDRQGIDIRDVTAELSSMGFSRIFSRETREFSRDQIAWFELDNRTGAPYGRGKTQKIKKQAENLINGDIHRSKFWQENEFHKGFLNVPETMPQNQVKELKKRFNGSAGDEHELPIIGAEDADYVSIDPNPEEMQFLESHKFFTKLAASIYGLNANEIGFTEDSSRNVSEQQQKNVWNRTTQPTLEMIERVFTNQILPFMREYNSVEDTEFRFKFKPQNDFLEQIENDMIAQEEELGTLTLNEARERKGKEGFGEIGELPKPAFDSLATQNPGFVAEKFGIEDAPQNDPGQAPLFGNSFENNNDNADSDGTDSTDNKSTGDTKTDDDDETGRGEEYGESVRPKDNQDTEVKDVEDVDLTPPEAVKHAAETALRKKDEFSDDIGDCGTGVGESRARKIVNEDLEPEDFLGGENTAIPDYLESHEEDVNGLNKPTSEWTDDDWTGRSISSDGSPRCGPVQYALWGGVSTGTGLEWATSTEQELQEAKEDEEEQDSRGKEMGNGDARDQNTSSYIDSYRKVFDRKDEVLEQTKDTLRNQHGFDDVDGIVSAKDDLKDDVATVFKSISLQDQLREAFPETEQDDEILVDADEIVESVSFRDRLASVLESKNLETLELSAEHHEKEIESEAEERFRLPDEVKVELGFDVFDTFTADVIRQEALSNATEIEDTIRDRLKNEILQGAQDGDSIPGIVERIQSVKDSFSDDHAELVARTETLSASRKGSQALAESTDLVGGKEWIATDDSRTREWHSVMDGTVIEKDSQFTVPRVSDDQPDNYPRTARVVGEDQPFNCFDNKTEVLTENGWKLFRNVEKDERVYTFNMKTQELELQQTTGYIEKEVDEILRYEGDSVSIGATPEHNMIVTYGNGPKKRTLGDIKENNNTFVNIPNKTNGLTGKDPETYTIEKVSGEHEYQDELYKDEWAEKEVAIETWAEFLGVYLGDGFTTITDNTYSTRIAATKERKQEHAKELLDKMGYDYTVTDEVVIVENKQLALETKELSKGANNKAVPSYVFEWDKELVDTFLDGYTSTDGNVTEYGSRRIWTTSEEMADQLQQLFILTGKDASIIKQERDKVEIIDKEVDASDLYCVQERKRENKSISQRENDIKEVDYKGKVRCLETPNGTLIVRRNKKAMIAGNCRCSQAPVLAEDLPDELDAMQELSGVNLNMGITERQFEVWKEHSSFSSFERFWKDSQKNLSKSEMADRFEMSKSTVYSWSS
jgi:hypothetical protein